jgi:hypothetical protein
VEIILKINSQSLFSIHLDSGGKLNVEDIKFDGGSIILGFQGRDLSDREMRRYKLHLAKCNGE